MSAPEQTILVVEDDEIIQAFLALHLENEGYAVRTAAYGMDMIQSLSDKTPDLTCSTSTCLTGTASI